MKQFPKWLLVPPAVALLLVLGPLSMQGGATADPAAERAAALRAATAPLRDDGAGTETPAADANTTRSNPRTPAAPRTPDLWQMASALAGVLLLGVVGVAVLRKLRGGASPSGGGSLLTLRQTLRLSPQRALHAIEFDDRVLLVGENERGLTLIDRGRLPNSVADEAEVLARTAVQGRVDATVGDDDDDGAVPKDLVIPRPPAAARAAADAARERRTARLADFRNLLQQAGR